ncbi:hypothetical protein C4D60_Mb11t15140 [Musa balbisiana]|uniref:aldehyde oxygenase (deformylating) n=1 Tax=Musa balbisiana TaxID=52838 RepID=A0A4S8J5S8_MUSBA|nr:hypothetical protein C4D60_Mb11t15140 [Musa balbisiana]
MASRPGLFTEWPWQRLGNFKVSTCSYPFLLLFLMLILVVQKQLLLLLSLSLSLSRCIQRLTIYLRKDFSDAEQPNNAVMQHMVVESEEGNGDEHHQYLVLAPWNLHSLYLLVSKERKELDLTYLIILPSLLLRMLHNQVWISLARFQNARSKNRIVDKSIEFEQDLFFPHLLDIKRNTTGTIKSSSMGYCSIWVISTFREQPTFQFGGQMEHCSWLCCIWGLWSSSTTGFTGHCTIISSILDITLTIMLQLLPSPSHEFNRNSILFQKGKGNKTKDKQNAYVIRRNHMIRKERYANDEANTFDLHERIIPVIHPFAEHVVYFLLFSIPMVTTIVTGRASILALLGYVAYIDLMNNMGHCNFELVPKWLFTAFPPLKYLMYTPSFHSLHHTQFRTNYSLFMPFYDYIYSTMDKSSDDLYERSLKGKEEVPDVVHLTHLTTLQSIYHLRIGFASLASKPYNSKMPILLIWPVAWISMLLTWIYSSSFTVERNGFKKIKMQTWAIPRFKFQYGLPNERDAINDLIEKAILEAEDKGVKANELNGNGELYLHKYPNLRLRIVDGSSLAAAVVLNSIPPETKKVALCGNLSKVAYRVASVLCQRCVEVMMTRKHEYYMLKSQIPESIAGYLLLSNNQNTQVWLVGDGLEDVEQRTAPKGTLFIPYSSFPPKKVRKDCTYCTTPAMKMPDTVENMHSCENWLPRRVMSASRVAGIVHALEGWDSHECGDKTQDIDKMWSAALRHDCAMILLETAIGRRSNEVRPEHLASLPGDALQRDSSASLHFQATRFKEAPPRHSPEPRRRALRASAWVKPGNQTSVLSLNVKDLLAITKENEHNAMELNVRIQELMESVLLMSKDSFFSFVIEH